MPGLKLVLPMSFTDNTLPKLPTLLASDSFTRADGALGSTETLQGAPARVWEVDANITVAGGKWQATGQTTNRTSRVNVGSTDMKVKAAWHAGAGGILARWADSANHYRLLKGNVGLELYRVRAGAAVALMGPGPALVAGDTVTLQVAGAVISVYKNDALVWSITDADPLLAGTRAGLRSDFNALSHFDDLMVTDF